MKFAKLISIFAVLASNQVAAQSWDSGSVLGGSATATTSPYVYGAAMSGGPTGAPCDQAVFAGSLSNQWTNAVLGGRIDGASLSPIVARNFSSNPAAFAPLYVGPGDLLLLPGGTGRCASVVVNLPSGTTGTFEITGSFQGAFAQNGGAGGIGSGDGVRAVVRVPVGGFATQDITPAMQTSAGRQTFNVTHNFTSSYAAVQFVVHMNANRTDDWTVLNFRIRRIDNVGPGTGVLTAGTLSQIDGIRNADLLTATAMGDPITMTGTPNNPRSNCCGPWAGVDIIPSLVPTFPTGAGGPYTMSFTPSAALNAQMSAYLNYLHALNPAVTQLTMSWQAANLGTGATAATSGTTIGADQSVTWQWTSGGVTINGGGFWTGAPFPLTSWIGFQTTLSVNGGQAGAALLGPDCRSSWSAWRAQPQQIVQGGAGQGGSAPGRIVFETINARGQVQRSQPITVRPGVPIETGQIRERPRH